MKIIHSIKASHFFLAATLGAALGLVSPAFGKTVSYLIEPDGMAIELGSLGGETTASAINDIGQVVGSSWTTANVYHPFITGPDGAGIRDLLSHPDASGMNGTAAAINDAGEVAGSFDVLVDDYWWYYYYSYRSHPNPTQEQPDRVLTSHAFITGPSGKGVVDLSPGEESNISSHAYAINDSGQVAMTKHYSEKGEFIDIGFVTGPHGSGEARGTFGSAARGINNAGEVVGWTDVGMGWSGSLPDGERAFITIPNVVDMRDIGVLVPGGNSSALAINEAGQVVGWSDTADGSYHAFITGSNGVGMIDLGTLGGSGSNSSANDINDRGQVVGWFDTAGGYTPHAFITSFNGHGMTDLNLFAHLPRGVTLTEAVGINNLGQVVAVGVIPEPASYSLMLGGLALIELLIAKKRPIQILSQQQ